MDLKSLYNILMVEKPSEYFLRLTDMKLKKEFPYLAVLKDVEQDLRHHPEGSVFNHTMMVIDVAAKIRKDAECPFEFMLTALLHDIGKVHTRSVDSDGGVHFYRHDETGCNMVDKLYFINEPSIKLYVKNMIYNHMRCNSFIRTPPTDKAFKRLFRKAYCPNDLILLAKADHLGRAGRENETYDKELEYLMGKLETCCPPLRKIHVTDNTPIPEPKNGYRLYKKLDNLSMHCIRSLDVAKKGTKLSLQTLEGIMDFEANNENIIMIGPYSDPYIINKKHFNEKYIVGEQCTTKNVRTIARKNGWDIPFIHKCKLKKDNYIYAKLMTEDFSVKSKYQGSIMKGKAFSYKAIDPFDEDNRYIIEEYVFKHTYSLYK